MSVTIDGTNGVTASASFYGQSTFTGTYTDGIVVDYTTGTGRITVGAADGLKIRNGGTASPTDLVTVDSSGNVGIGTSSPTAKLQVNGGTAIQGGASFPSSGYGWEIYNSDSTNNYLQSYNRNSSAYMNSIYNAISHQFFISGIEKARIDPSGNLLMGGTSAISGSFTGLQMLDRQVVMRNSNATAGRLHYMNVDSSNTFVVYDQNNTGVYIANGATSWTANSDERIKDIIEPITDAASKVSTLRAVIGKYKQDEEGTRRSFLIAQDVQAVLPEAVNVQEDEIGTLGVSYTDVIPLLVAAIKEQQAIIEQLRADVAALKAA